MEENQLNSTQKATEEVNRRNVKAAVDHSNATRKIVRLMEAQTQEFKDMVAQQNMRIDQLEEQIRTLLIAKYTGNPTG